MPRDSWRSIGAGKALKAGLNNAPATSTHPVRVVIADEHKLFREGLRALLSPHSDIQVASDVQNGDDVVRVVTELEPHVLLLDDHMPGRSALDLLMDIHARGLNIRTILVTAGIEKREFARMVQYGVRGVVSRDSPGEMLYKSIRKVHQGEVWIGREEIASLVELLMSPDAMTPTDPAATYKLTAREREVLRLIVAGDSNKEIAVKLHVGRDTVKHHLTRVFNKTGVSNRLELALFALHHNLISRP